MLEAAVSLKQQGIHAEVVKLTQIKPLDLTPVLESVRKTGRLFVAEESGGRRLSGQSSCLPHLAQDGHCRRGRQEKSWGFRM